MVSCGAWEFEFLHATVAFSVIVSEQLHIHTAHMQLHPEQAYKPRMNPVCASCCCCCCCLSMPLQLIDIDGAALLEQRTALQRAHGIDVLVFAADVCSNSAVERAVREHVAR
jgi:hypothetical protein